MLRLAAAAPAAEPEAADLFAMLPVAPAATAALAGAGQRALPSLRSDT
jgi:hypothetical protein